MIVGFKKMPLNLLRALLLGLLVGHPVTAGAGSLTLLGVGAPASGAAPHTEVSVITTTGAGTWSVPANFVSLTSVECVAAGGSSANSASQGGGGGGAYTKITSTSTTLTPGVTSINIGVGAGGAT